MVARGFGDQGACGQWAAAHLQGAGRLDQPPCAWLVADLGVKPGNRVLIRSANNPAACWLAATKAGAVVVNTMPMLRAGELAAGQGRN